MGICNGLEAWREQIKRHVKLFLLVAFDNNG